MICKICLADDPKYFVGTICRRCIHLHYGVIDKDHDYLIGDKSEYRLSFEMNKYQIDIAHKIVKYIEKQDVFLEAVCGAGKTEMCYELLKDTVEKKKRIAWAIPRRQVVLELKERIQSNFRDLKVVAVCEGFTDDVYGDIVICTTHQLYRYHQYFDVLIVDEPDAFPFNNDPLLLGLMKSSVKGNVLFMSATKDDALISKLNNPKHLIMPLRPNLKPLPIPELKRSYLSIFHEYAKISQEKLLIFVPTIQLARKLSQYLRIPCVTSKSEDKESLIESFHKKTKGILITTTILERGVTFKDCYVWVFEAHHPIFDVSSLTQICGRVLRGSSTKGTCIFFSTQKCKEVERCIENLKQTNILAQSVLNPKI